MKASVSPVAALAACLLAIAVQGSFAADTIVQKDGQRREGEILGVRADSIRFKVGPVETGIPLASVTAVQMEAPKAFQDALAAWQKGDAATTVARLKPLVETFQGLPTQWASRASALLGEANLAAGDIPAAEAAFAAFQKNYPADADLAAVGLAALDVAKKDYTAAREKLAPLVEQARGLKSPRPGQSATLGQALFLMGQVNEASGESPEALENYLLAVTVFREDQAVVAKAQERATQLGQKNVVVP